MNGIKNAANAVKGLSGVIFFFSIFAALAYEYGKRRETVDYLFVRWSTYQAFCLKVALGAAILWQLASLATWIIRGIQQERRRQDTRLVRQTEDRVHVERDESDRIRERNARQISDRWAREAQTP
jgi:hypothetical protein